MKHASDRKIKANRVNARASTGPNTSQGRIRSARNALRHALSLPIYSDPVLSEEVQALTRKIAGADANAEMQELAQRIAEAHIDLRRVRDARHRLLSQVLTNHRYDSRANVRKITAVLRDLLLGHQASGAPVVPPDKCLSATLEGREKLTPHATQDVRHLSAMDRYERRARSRRKFAIRVFDHAKRRSSQ